MYALVLLIASGFALLGIGQVSRSTPTPAASIQAAVRREETESKATPDPQRRTAVEPVCPATLDRLDTYCRGDYALRERLIDSVSSRNPPGGRPWAVSKTEYDYWRDTR
jgi:hypothetical protein